MKNPTAVMIVIGDEILSGRTRDANMHHIAKELTLAGIDLIEARFISDDGDQIVKTINAVREKQDYVFTSGGIGPTHDDITADCIARAFGVKIDIREDARRVLATNYPNGEADLTPARLRMARIPDTAKLIDNPVSKAPGFSIGNVHVMAGIPSVFNAMLAGLLPTLIGGRPVQSESIRIEKPESVISAPLGAIAKAFPELSIGSYPFYEGQSYGTNVVVRGIVETKISAAMSRIKAELL
ncbi:MAG: molybdopterin-binding protein [Pseudomonadota bacterium]